MLPEGVYSDNCGGGYFSQYVVWWWVPTLTVIVAVAALPSVPYAKRIGARGVVASLVNKVICFRNIVGFACTTVHLASLLLCGTECHIYVNKDMLCDVCSLACSAKQQEVIRCIQGSSGWC